MIEVRRNKEPAIAAMHGPHILVRSGYEARFGPFR